MATWRGRDQRWISWGKCVCTRVGHAYPIYTHQVNAHTYPVAQRKPLSVKATHPNPSPESQSQSLGESTCSSMDQIFVTYQWHQLALQTSWHSEPLGTRTYGWDSHAGPHDQLVLNFGLGPPRWCSEPIPIIPYHCMCSKHIIMLPTQQGSCSWQPTDYMIRPNLLLALHIIYILALNLCTLKFPL